MKYIRTLYGIYALKKKLKHDIDVYRFFEGKVIGSQRYYDVTIVAEADTIAELCDEFVIVYETNDFAIYSELEWAIDKAARSSWKSQIYSAIWTDKGLIYVAKMNDKGELELL